MAPSARKTHSTCLVLIITAKYSLLKRFSRGYSERQKMIAILVIGLFVEVFLTPQTLGGGTPFGLRSTMNQSCIYAPVLIF